MLTGLKGCAQPDVQARCSARCGAGPPHARVALRYDDHLRALYRVVGTALIICGNEVALLMRGIDEGEEGSSGGDRASSTGTSSVAPLAPARLARWY